MNTITTKTGKTFNVAWCAPSTIDYALRFGVNGADMQTVLTTFTNPAETEKLIHQYDEKETVYTGYTTFKGVDLNPNGVIVVALMTGG